MATPHTVSAPHSQSTPHFGTWQHTPVLSHVSTPQVQSVGHVAQFSPGAQIPSPQTGMHVPPWHVVPEGQAGPHVPPHPSGPHIALAHAGVQQVGAPPPMPGLQT
jgi:hypothetical protein